MFLYLYVNICKWHIHTHMCVLCKKFGKRGEERIKTPCPFRMIIVSKHVNHSPVFTHRQIWFVSSNQVLKRIAASIILLSAFYFLKHAEYICFISLLSISRIVMHFTYGIWNIVEDMNINKKRVFINEKKLHKIMQVYATNIERVVYKKF